MEEANCIHPFNGQDIIQSKFPLEKFAFCGYSTPQITHNSQIVDKQPPRNIGDSFVTVKMLPKFSLYFRDKGNFAPRVLINKDVYSLIISMTNLWLCAYL